MERIPRQESLRLRTVFFVVFALFSLHINTVNGGVCWSTINEDGRCTNTIQRDMTSKDECCRIGGGRAAWTEENYDSGQAFFWTALGNGAPNCLPCSTSCDGITCPDREICTLRNGAPRCACPTTCPVSTPEKPLKPVCSGEGITYRSECHMNKRNCRLRLIDFLNYEGYCQHSCETVTCRPDQQCIEDNNHTPYCTRCMDKCPDVYNPMCGSDGVTYNNMCDLNRAACRNRPKDIKYAHRGLCNASATCDSILCNDLELCVYDTRQSLPKCVRCDLDCNSAPEQPVCGSDGITYQSWCEMRKNSCIFGALIHVDHMGDCTTLPLRRAPIIHINIDGPTTGRRR